MTTAREIVTPDATRLGALDTAGRRGGTGGKAPGPERVDDVHMLLTHRLTDDDTLLVRLLPGLSIRSRAAATLALDELLAAYSPRHVVLEVPGVPTAAVLSAVLRGSRSCQVRGTVLSVVAPAAPTLALLRDSLRATGRVYGSTGEALAAARRTDRAS
ncbi:hypothetical protein ACGFYU_01785 [Streptomyces sp. NPDC048337]|uniref:hypothetical protein n=1 Tax=Streptomyces sp. NPDC048337 TaxID=3365535 RepID=UPI0037132C3E